MRYVSEGYNPVMYYLSLLLLRLSSRYFPLFLFRLFHFNFNISFFRFANKIDVKNMEASFNDSITVLRRDHDAACTSLTYKLIETEEVLKTKIGILLQVETEKERVMVDLSFTEQELKEEKASRLEEKENAKIALENFFNEKKEEMILLREGGQEQMQRLIDHHEVNLATEIGKNYENNIVTSKL